MSHRIPNSLVLVVLLAFLPAAWFVGMSPGAVLLNLGLAVVVTATAVLFLSQPPGVAKLLGALTFWIGFDSSLLTFIAVTYGVMVATFGVLKMVGKPAENLPFLPYATLGFAVVFASTPVGHMLLNAALSTSA